MANLSIVSLLERAVSDSASDLHLMVGRVPVFRIHGELGEGEKLLPITAAEMEGYVAELLTAEQRAQFELNKEFGFAYQLSDDIRFRIHFLLERGKPSIAARVIRNVIPTTQEIGLSENAVKLIEAANGLVLVTGQTGHGKSTTLASLIEYVNTHTSKHIVTLEDPIEYVFNSKKSLIKQRELGSDMNSFHESLKHVMRHDPDIIMVGEMRDIETMRAAITLAETGHLVLSTLHTNSAPQTINRIIDAFPAEQQNQIRSQLSLSLRGIISQRLVQTKDGKRVAARELLLNTPAIAYLIRENKIEQIGSVLQTGLSAGMMTLQQHLSELALEGTISADQALAEVD